MKRIKEYFKNKTAEQIFSLYLLCGIVLTMLFCAIVRLCGGLWFSADFSQITAPSKELQEAIKGALLIFELLFVYKILSRTSFLLCFFIATIETLIGILLGEFVNNSIISNLFYMACIFIIPFCFHRSFVVLLESGIYYVVSFIYCALFLVGRIGGIDSESAYNFYISVIGSIDQKLFSVALYLVVKYFGGIKLWKTQKRLIFQIDLTTKKETE